MALNRKHPHFTTVLSIVFFSTLCFTPAASAQLIPDVATLVANLSHAIPNLMRLVTALAYVMGMIFVYKGIMKLKEYGESRTMMSQHHELKKPMILFFVGAALLYLPTSVQVGLSTFWDTTVPYAYVAETSDPWSELLHDCFLIIQLIGTIAFIRGLVVLSHLSGQGGAQPGTFGKGMAYIIGGILCINMYEFVQVVLNTLALGQV